MSLNLVSSPWLAIIFLLATRCIEPQVIVKGLVGTKELEPYSILVLFYAIAYICISLDQTGFLRYSALLCIKKTGRDGRKTFLGFFLLTTIASALTSNDAVILTATSFLIYFTAEAKIPDSRAFLMSEFTTANIASMALYIGNPTNVVMAQANGITVAAYSAWMILPTLVCTFLAFVILRYILFNNEELIPKSIEVNADEIDPGSALKDRGGAIFGVVLLGLCLATLMGTGFLGIPVWMVTMPFAAISLGRDVWNDLFQSRRKESNPDSKLPPNKHGDTSAEELSSSQENLITEHIMTKFKTSAMAPEVQENISNLQQRANPQTVIEISDDNRAPSNWLKIKNTAQSEQTTVIMSLISFVSVYNAISDHVWCSKEVAVANSPIFSGNVYPRRRTCLHWLDRQDIHRLSPPISILHPFDSRDRNINRTSLLLDQQSASNNSSR
ncbi:hypothetical protein HDU97_000141 [Phlyctochytrium planicorne]|nr:hypothetical protein HDU97_000141 [Phlyctochytrium planicorne]